jgi:hypothetical protein
MRGGFRTSLYLLLFIYRLSNIGIERLRDGLRQELRMGLAVLQFPTVRDFIVAAQSLEAVAAAGRQESDGQVLWEQKSVKSLHRLQGDLLF